MNDHNQLTKTVPFPTFSDGLAFTNAIGTIAETLNHHPDILLQWGRVCITIWTHAVGALTDLDIEFARQVDRLTEVYPPIIRD